MNFYNESKKIDSLLEIMIKENPISSNDSDWLKFIRLVKVELNRLEEKIKDIIDVETEEMAKGKCCENMLRNIGVEHERHDT